MLGVVAERAARLCEATDAHINKVESDLLYRVVSYGSMQPPSPICYRRPLSRGDMVGLAVIDRQSIHVHDITTEFTEFPESKALRKRAGSRTILATPLLREGDSIGLL